MTKTRAKWKFFQRLRNKSPNVFQLIINFQTKAKNKLMQLEKLLRALSRKDNRNSLLLIDAKILSLISVIEKSSCKFMLVKETSRMSSNRSDLALSQSFWVAITFRVLNLSMIRLRQTLRSSKKSLINKDLIQRNNR